MPLIPFYSGPFANIYIGNYDDSTNPLTLFPTSREDGVNIVGGIPRKVWEVATGSHHPQEDPVIEFTVTFIAIDDDVIKVSKGIKLSQTSPVVNTTIDDLPGLANYSVFLQHPNENSQFSYWIPRVCSNSLISLDTAKRIGKLPIRFYFEAEELNIRLYNQGTYSEMISAMGARSPI